jgi:hypothetical protein
MQMTNTERVQARITGCELELEELAAQQADLLNRLADGAEGGLDDLATIQGRIEALNKVLAALGQALARAEAEVLAERKAEQDKIPREHIRQAERLAEVLNQDAEAAFRAIAKAVKPLATYQQSLEAMQTFMDSLSWEQYPGFPMKVYNGSRLDVMPFIQDALMGTATSMDPVIAGMGKPVVEVAKGTTDIRLFDFIRAVCRCFDLPESDLPEVPKFKIELDAARKEASEKEAALRAEQSRLRDEAQQKALQNFGKASRMTISTVDKNGNLVEVDSSPCRKPDLAEIGRQLGGSPFMTGG